MTRRPEDRDQPPLDKAEERARQFWDARRPRTPAPEPSDKDRTEEGQAPPRGGKPDADKSDEKPGEPTDERPKR